MSNIGIEQRNVNLIDWRKISTNITSGLEKEMQRREELKTKIDDDTRKLEEDISKTPIGNNDRVNGWISQYSSMATENLLAINRALKNGGVNPRDYTTFLANSKSSTTRVFDAIKAYNEESKAVNERIQKGIASKQEPQLMGMIEGFADLSKSMPVFQSDGTLQIAKMKDGKQIDGADGRITINQLMGIMGMRVNKFDLNGAAESAVEGMGDFVKEALATEGGAKSLAQVLKIKDKSQIGQLDEKGRVIESTYSKSEQLFADQILSSDWNVASILFDHSGGVVNSKAYQITQDPEVAKKGENYVLYSYIDGKLQPDFSSSAPNGAKQRKIAEQLVKDNIRSRIDKEVTIRTERPQLPPERPAYQRSAAEIEASEKRAEKQSALDLWMKLFTAKTPQEKQAAKSGLLGTAAATREKLLDIDVSNGKQAWLRFEDPTKDRPIPLNTTGSNWAISGRLIHGIENVSSLENRYKGITPSMLSEQEWKNVGGGAAGGYIEAPAISTDILKLPSQNAAPAINEILKPYGFKVVDKSNWFNNTISIQKVDEKGKSVGEPFTFESKSGQEANTIMNITKWLESQLNPNVAPRI
jgi:hypothetical protein